MSEWRLDDLGDGTCRATRESDGFSVDFRAQDYSTFAEAFGFDVPIGEVPVPMPPPFVRVEHPGCDPNALRDEYRDAFIGGAVPDLTPDEVVRNADDFWDGPDTNQRRAVVALSRQLFAAREALRGTLNVPGCWCDDAFIDGERIGRRGTPDCDEEGCVQARACLPEHQQES